MVHIICGSQVQLLSTVDKKENLIGLSDKVCHHKWRIKKTKMLIILDVQIKEI